MESAGTVGHRPAASDLAQPRAKRHRPLSGVARRLITADLLTQIVHHGTSTKRRLSYLRQHGSKSSSARKTSRCSVDCRTYGFRKCKSGHNGAVKPLSMAASVNMKVATIMSTQPADSMIFLGMPDKTPRTKVPPNRIVDPVRLPVELIFGEKVANNRGTESPTLKTRS